jgi:hypothetical protein
MATLECKVAMCFSRLVEFELLLELKFEQKSGTSLHTTRFKDVISFKTVERLSVPVMYFDIRQYNERDLAKNRTTKFSMPGYVKEALLEIQHEGTNEDKFHSSDTTMLHALNDSATQTTKGTEKQWKL